ncbi:aminotransferase class I/II-fold pyridoxal phosphate-dependent enzyme [Planctomycetes bacterium CA13]
MSNDPQVVRAATEAADKYGLSATGSRATTGNHSLYIELERSVSDFFGTQGAIVSPSGYLSNTILLQAIADDFDAFFIDEKSHSSLADAAKQFAKPTYSFHHLDSQDLAKQLARNLIPNAKPLVLTDGVFPSRGEIAPLMEYANVLNAFNGKILVDDAHAIAVIGQNGRGTWEDQHVSPEIVYQTGTLSKGFGVGGGIVAANSRTIEKVHRHSLAFVGSTGLALPIAAAALQSVSHLAQNKHLITDLQKRTLALKQRFKKIGFSMPMTAAPIFSITLEDSEKNQRLSHRLIENGVYPPYINYPGAPQGGHFRFILTSSTTHDQEDRLLETIESAL